MSWRNAKSLVVLRNQINAEFPSRNKASDGTIGDSRHCPGSSDHCAKRLDGRNPKVVTAMDITHDPRSGCDGRKIVDALVAIRDPRIKYIIWDKHIISSVASPWTWRNYNGSNPHTKHFHLSVNASKSLFDSTAPWQISGLATSPPPSSLGARYRVIARSGLRLREGPGTEFDIIGRLSPNDVVVVTGTEGDWYEIDRNGDGMRDGFAFGAFLVKL